MVLKGPEGIIFEHYLRLNFFATNNKGEYEAFIMGLRSINNLKVFELHIFSNSKLVINQVTKKLKLGSQYGQVFENLKNPPHRI